MVAGTYRPERCGVAHYTERLRRALNERGVSSLVLTTREAARASKDPDVRGVVRGWGLPDLPALARAVRGAVHDEGADVIHIQHAAGTYGFKRAVFLLTGSDALITTNYHAETAISKRLPWLAPRLHRVPLVANVDVAPVDRSEVGEEVRAQYGWAREAEII